MQSNLLLKTQLFNHLTAYSPLGTRPPPPQPLKPSRPHRGYSRRFAASRAKKRKNSAPIPPLQQSPACLIQLRPHVRRQNRLIIYKVEERVDMMRIPSAGSGSGRQVGRSAGLQPAFGVRTATTTPFSGGLNRLEIGAPQK